jgi:NTE family protein
MYANIVFAGGGVKGAVLGGCFHACDDAKVTAVGFGGTSAGSIVALLASVGYSGRELETLLTETSFLDFLDDGGDKLSALKQDFAQFSETMPMRSWSPKVIHDKWRCYQKAKNHLASTRGLYDGNRLVDFLVEKVAIKLGKDQVTVRAASFSDLREMGGKPLRVVATDLNSCHAVLLGNDENDVSAIQAVRASAGYPIVFKPVELGGRRLVDGGLSSNLPAFLFETEYIEDRVPTLAFDLVSPKTDLESNPSNAMRVEGDEVKDSCETERANDWTWEEGREFASLLLGSALEASDVILRETTSGVAYFPIQTPPGINTLDFDLPREKRAACFNAGFRGARERLSKFEPIARTGLTSEELKATLIRDNGPPSIYEPILRALMDQINAVCTGDLGRMRAHIMLLTGRQSDNAASTRIIAYSLGMGEDNDSTLEIDQHAGCSGAAWETQKIHVADLRHAREDPTKWHMTDVQHRQVPDDIQSMISASIPGSVHKERAPKTPVGTVSVDCEASLANTGWLAADEPNQLDVGKKPESLHGLDKNVSTVIESWAKIISAVLP